jgi:hydrogenase expression/formation protein HypC
MCLGVPGRIVSIDAGGLLATVDFFGVRRVVRLELIDQPVAPGDYVLNHVGYAIRRIPEDDIDGTLALYEQLVRDAGETGNDDLMAADVRGELQATTGGAVADFGTAASMESQRTSAGSEPRERSGDSRGPRERPCGGVRGAKPLGK